MEQRQDELIRQALSALKGLRLSDTFSAADLRSFGFGALTATDKGSYPEYEIHIQCPWRLQTRSAILTGFDDYFVPKNEEPGKAWRPGAGTPSLQDAKCYELVFGKDGKMGSPRSDAPIVEHVFADRFGGAEIHLTGEISLVIFPCASKGDAWRLFKPEQGAPHFVVTASDVGYVPG